jgi:hypothetical protein
VIITGIVLLIVFIVSERRRTRRAAGLDPATAEDY